MPTGIYERKPLSKAHKANIGAGLSRAYFDGRRLPTRGGWKWLEESRVKLRKPKSESTRSKMSMGQRLSNNNNWRGGISRSKHATKEYKEWRMKVFERDDFTCLICGQRGGKLNADHIKRWSLFPLLRFEVSNGRTLCETCHKKTPNYGNKKTTI